MNTDPHRNQPLLQSGLALDKADHVMILLHGRGGSPEDMFSLGEALGGPEFAYLAPLAANHTWYLRSFLSPISENEPFLSSALSRVQSILDQAAAIGIPSDHVIIVGFSQGACLATEFVARHPRRYAGLVSFTGGRIGPPDSEFPPKGQLFGTPVYFGSGDPDPHVPWERVRKSAEALEKMGANVSLHRYPLMGHTVTDEEIESARHHILGLTSVARR